MVKSWEKGKDLLNSKYQGNKGGFFDAIERGQIVPFDPMAESRQYGQRLTPAHFRDLIEEDVDKEKVALILKVIKVESLKEFLGLSDREHLKVKFEIEHDNDDPEAFELFKLGKEGETILRKLAQLRSQKQQEYDELFDEIGDAGEVLFPSVAWRGITFNSALQKELFEAVYLVGDQPQEGHQWGLFTIEQRRQRAKGYYKELCDQGEDEKIILARLNKKFELTPGQIAKSVGYAEHLLNYDSRRRATARDIVKGEEMLRKREKSK